MQHFLLMLMHAMRIWTYVHTVKDVEAVSSRMILEAHEKSIDGVEMDVWVERRGDGCSGSSKAMDHAPEWQAVYNAHCGYVGPPRFRLEASYPQQMCPFIWGRMYCGSKRNIAEPLACASCMA